MLEHDRTRQTVPGGLEQPAPDEGAASGASESLIDAERAMAQRLDALGVRLVDLHSNVAAPEVVVPWAKRPILHGWMARSLKIGAGAIAALVVLGWGVYELVGTGMMRGGVPAAGAGGGVGGGVGVGAVVTTAPGATTIVTSRGTVPTQPVIDDLRNRPPLEIELALEHPTLAALRAIQTPEQTAWLVSSDASAMRVSRGFAASADSRMGPRLGDVLLGASGPSLMASELAGGLAGGLASDVARDPGARSR